MWGRSGAVRDSRRLTARLVTLCAAIGIIWVAAPAGAAAQSTTAIDLDGTYTLSSPDGLECPGSGRFKIIPGYVHAVTLTVKGKLLATLKRRHRLRARLTTNARDAARRHNHKKRKTAIQLTYVRAAKPPARS